MSGSRFAWPNAFSVDAAGVPRSGAKLYFYSTGTNTPQATYADAALSVPNTNPVISDALGQFGSIFLVVAPSYRVKLTDSSDNEIWTLDPVGPLSGSGQGGSVPTGGMMPFGGTVVPTGWLLCDGSTVSRTTYAVLYAAIQTAYGIGDGSTTFGIPDYRGRTFVGRDDMGGSAANRVTSAISGIDGITLGASGGDQRVQTHNHTLTDPGHDHTDSGHDHPTNGVQFPTTGGPLAASGSFAFNFPSATVSSGNANIQSASTGITIDTFGAGGSQNMPPALVANVIIYAGT